MWVSSAINVGLFAAVAAVIVMPALRRRWILFALIALLTVGTITKGAIPRPVASGIN